MLVGVLLASAAPAQGQAATSDSEALNLAAKALLALTGGRQISDVTLTGTVTRDFGESDSGTVTLEALGTGESRIDMNLAEGVRTEIRDASTGTTEGNWTNPNGTSGTMAFHDTLTDAVWFFPALGSLADGPNVVLSYIGQETRDGVAVQHIRSCVVQSGDGDPILQQLSTMDFYLDAATLLPVSITFNTHPDENELVNLPIEVGFSNYQTIHGVVVPMRIRRKLQGHVVEDIVVTGASFNTGIPLTTFAMN